jgi:hypothetical protein
MTETLQAEERGADPLIVEDHIRCFRCGYNVRGLSRDGLCPECGSAVGESIRRHRLGVRGLLPMDAADPRWVRKLAWSLTLILLSIVAVLLWEAIALSEVELPRWFQQAAYISPSFMLALGAWINASHEPTFTAVFQDRWLRRSIRAAVIAWIVTLLFLSRTASVGDWDGMYFWRPAVIIAAALLSWTFLWRQRNHARRLDYRPLRILLTWLAWIVPAATLTLLHPHARSIEVEEAWLFMLISDPIFGDIRLPLLLARSLVNFRRLDALTAFFTVFALIVLTSVTTLAWLCLAYWRAARRSADGAPSLSATSP